MPNSGHRWTKVEEEDAVEFDWDTFSRLYPYITFDAYRIRRSAVLRATSKQPTRTGLRGLIHRVICRD